MPVNGSGRQRQPGSARGGVRWVPPRPPRITKANEKKKDTINPVGSEPMVVGSLWWNHLCCALFIDFPHSLFEDTQNLKHGSSSQKQNVFSSHTRTSDNPSVIKSPYLFMINCVGILKNLHLYSRYFFRKPCAREWISVEVPLRLAEYVACAAATAVTRVVAPGAASFLRTDHRKEG